jgi:hypothetical protein
MEPEPKSNALLKTLSEERQAQIFEWATKPNDLDGSGKPIPLTGGLAYARSQLSADGVSVSLDTLSEFRRWYRARQKYRRALASSEQQRELMLRFRPEDAKLAREFAEFILLQQANEEEDPALIALAAKVQDSRRALDMEERSGKERAEIARTKLAQKDRDFALEREKFVCASLEKILQAARDPKTREVVESEIPQAEKIAWLRKSYFADIDALEVQLPE